METFSRLKRAALTQNQEGELPDFILPMLMQVAENPARFAGREELVAQLAEAVESYETFSEMCCEKMGFSLEDIHRLLDELRIRY